MKTDREMALMTFILFAGSSATY